MGFFIDLVWVGDPPLICRGFSSTGLHLPDFEDEDVSFDDDVIVKSPWELWFRKRNSPNV